MKITMEDLKLDIDSRLKRIAEDKKKFIEDFNENAAHALEWSKDMFKTVAEESVLMRMKSYLNQDVSIEDIKRELLEDTIRGAKYPPQSTSPTSNLLEQYKAVANAEAYEFFSKVEIILR